MDNNSFHYPDTNSARGEFEYLNRNFYDQKVAIIGLGGTGSYILDLIAKTPVKEIHLYDGDVFQLHNAFRAPGAISAEKLNIEAQLPKVQYFHGIYSNMHKGIVPHNEYLTDDNISELQDFNYVFICVDKNNVRRFIIDNLLSLGVTFIDSGLGVDLREDTLIGTMRVTTAAPGKSEHIINRIGSDDGEENLYSTNIQIAELNCLNATLAVIKWKKLSGFYQDLKNENNTLFCISTNKIFNDDFKT